MAETADTKTVVVTPAALQEYARAIFVGAGAPDPVARRVAGSLVLANRSGHDSHGAIRIPQYIRDIQAGQLDPRAEPGIAREGPAWALVDGRWTFGHETARFAMAEATRRARDTGVALVSTIRTNHIGRLGEITNDPSAMCFPVHSRNITGGTQGNRSRYANPEVDQLCDEAAQETDMDRRIELYEQIQQIVADDAIILGAYEQVLINTYSNAVTNVRYDAVARPFFLVTQLAAQ